jgi:beta-glucosidase
MTWPLAATDHPSTKGYPGTMDFYNYQVTRGYTGQVQGYDYTNHDENIYVGYRFFDTFNKEVAYPFGFGLSYTTFKYGKPAIVKNGDGWTVTVDVTNTGDREGKETVQLYIGEVKPAVERPAKELKNFAKLALKPGETKTAAFQITSEDLKYWDETVHGWKTAPGKYRAYVAASSADIRGTVGFEL